MWYVAVGKEAVGPMSKEDLLRGLGAGDYKPTTLVFAQGMAGWTAAGQVAELRPGASPGGALPPPAPGGMRQVAHEVEFEIRGEEMQFVEIELDPGEAVVAEAGGMMYMGDGIEMETIFGDGSSSGGGFMEKLVGAGKRLITGESLFMTVFTNVGGVRERVAFAAPYPGKIIPLNLAEMGGKMICQKDAFLCAARGVAIGIEFQRKIGVGLFGGEGFIMQKLEGDGLAFVHAGGTIVSRELKPGESLRVDTGCIVAFHPTVSYDIQFVGNVKSAIFGGEGFFFARLTGPGRVWLQSLPFSRLAGRIHEAAPQTGRGGRDEGSLLPGFGGLLGGR
jgi:uncharacterized protein (TIGR00266 family)